MNPPDVKRVVWAYLIENGRPTNGLWSYYGGGWDQPDAAKPYDYHRREAGAQALRAKVKAVGVDWSKTEMPEDGIEREFNGTFSEASVVPTMLGKLILQDGSTYLVGCALSNDERRFSDYIRKFNAFVEDVARVQSVFGEQPA